MFINLQNVQDQRNLTLKMDRLLLFSNMPII